MLKSKSASGATSISAVSSLRLKGSDSCWQNGEGFVVVVMVVGFQVEHRA